MRSLPPIVTAAGTLRIPLAEATARGLADALLAEPDEARQLLTRLADVDPALVLWTLLRAERFGRGHELQSTASIGQALAAELLPALAPLVEEDASQRESADRLAADAVQRAALSALVAALAAELADSAGADRGAAYLAGLLHNAPDWLAPTSEETIARAMLLQTLPAWHRSLIEAAQGETREADAVAAQVQRALRYLEHPHEPAAGGDAMHRALRQRERAAAHWRIAEPEAPRRLRELVRRLARLRELESRFGETLEREKLEAVRQLAYGAGHEINNPLANISARAQGLLKEETNPERRRRLTAINAQAYRAHEMIADLMLFSRPPDLMREETDVVRLLDRVADELEAEAQEQETVVRRLPGPASLVAWVDVVQLAVALRAMCVNALEALGRGGQIELAAREAAPDAQGRPWVEIVVADDGPGIPPEIRRHIFDPFFSGREAGRGLGFGLSKAWRIVQEHGGQIEVESRSPGATLVIRLPARRDAD